MKFIVRKAWLLFCVLFGLTLFATTPEKSRREKARYYYLEGVINRSQGKMAEAHELFRKAVETDDSYLEAQEAYNFGKLVMPADSIAEQYQAFWNMRPMVDAYPNDEYESEYYAYLAKQLREYDEAIRIYRRLDSISPDNTERLLHLAELYTVKNDLAKAYECYERYEKAEGKSSQISLRKIVYKLNMSDTIGAIAEADSLIAFNPQKAAFHILKGDVLTHLQQYDSAYMSYLDAEKVEPDNGDVKIAIANYFLNKGDSIEYDNKMYDALMCDDFDLSAKIEILAEYLQKLIDNQSDTNRGDHLFAVLRNQYPHEPEILDLAARYNAAMEKFEEAIENISYAIDMKPDVEQYWGQKMGYLLQLDRCEEVIECYNSAANYFEPTDYLSYLLAPAYMTLEEYDKTIEIYARLLHNIEPTLPIDSLIIDKAPLNSLSYDQLMRANALYTFIGDSYHQMNNRQSAFNAYENALIFFPESAATLNNYAYFLAVDGIDLDKAEKMSETAIKAEPDNATYIDTYAWVLFKKGDYENALKYQQQAIEKIGDDLSADVLEHMGDIYFKCNEPQKAIEYWEQALKLDSENELLQRKVKQKNYFEK